MQDVFKSMFSVCNLRLNSLDEKKDLQPLLKAKEKFEFIVSLYPDTDYSTDPKFKLDFEVVNLNNNNNNKNTEEKQKSEGSLSFFMNNFH